MASLKPLVEQPISVYLDWLYAEFGLLDQLIASKPTPELHKRHEDCAAAIRVYLRFVNAQIKAFPK